MAKRKKTATVQLKLRIREELRRKLEREAKGRKVSLNSEMARRLESSFESGTTEKLVQLLTGSPGTAELLTIIGRAMQLSQNYLKGDKDRGQITAAAVKKIVDAQFEDKHLSGDRFPDRENLKSPDWLAFNALLGHHYRHSEDEFEHDSRQASPDMKAAERGGRVKRRLSPSDDEVRS